MSSDIRAQRQVRSLGMAAGGRVLASLLWCSCGAACQSIHVCMALKLPTPPYGLESPSSSTRGTQKGYSKRQGSRVLDLECVYLILFSWWRSPASHAFGRSAISNSAAFGASSERGHRTRPPSVKSESGSEWGCTPTTGHG